MAEAGSMKLGVTLYSFSRDFFSYRYSFEKCLELVGSLGPGQGVEVVGPQSLRGFPEVSEESQQQFLHAVDAYGLVPTCFGGYGDPAIVTGRALSAVEQDEYLKAQMRTAHRLGFPVIRLSHTDRVIDLVPYAEKIGIKIGL